MATKTEVSNHFARQIVNIAAYVAFVVIAVCAGTIPFNGNYLMDVVARYNPDIVPAAYACYVAHVVVYVFLLCFAIYQALSHKRNDKAIRSIDLTFLVFVVASIVWTFGFFYGAQALALIGMFASSIAAFMIYHKLGIGKDRVTGRHYWCVHFPFSLVAAGALFGIVAQTSIFCMHYDLVWWGAGQLGWNMSAALLIAFFGSFILHYRPDVGFGLTLTWLAAGVAVYQNNENVLLTTTFALMALYFGLLTFSNAMHRPRVSKRDTK